MNEAPATSFRTRDASLLVLVLLATAAVYAPFLEHPFQYDSAVKIVGNRKLEDPLHYLRAFGRSGYSEDTTRFIPNLVLSLDRALFGQDPFGFHLISLLLHLANICLVYLLGRSVWRRLDDGESSAPLLAAAIFALHPLNSEAVNYSNALPNLMVTGFYLLALVSLLRATEPRPPGTRASFGAWALFWLSLAGALLSKELAVTVVVMAPLLLFWIAGRDPAHQPLLSGRRLVLVVVAILLGAVSLLATGAHHEVRKVILGSGERLTGSWPLTLLLTVLGQAEILLRYLWLGVVPWPGFLNVDHGRHLHLYRRALSADNGSIAVHYPELVLPVLASLALMALAAAAFRWRRRAPLLTFFCLWPLVTHAPTSLVPRGEPMVEYRTYLPMVGVCLALAWALRRALEAASVRFASLSLPTPRLVAAAIPVALLASGTAIRNTDWTTRLTLWRDSVQKNPHNYRAHTNLGKALAENGRPDEATQHYRRALELNPRYLQALNNLGNMYARQGRAREAIGLYRRALAVDEDYVEVLVNLGRTLAGQGDREEAERLLRRALEARPDFAEAHHNLAAVMEAGNRLDQAVAYYRRALELDPAQVQSHNNLGNLLVRQGKLAGATERYRRAIALAPHLAEAHGNLGRVLAMQGKPEQAIVSFRRALQLEPDGADVHSNLGTALAGLGRLQEASAAFRRALELQPNLADAHNNLGNVLSFQGNPSEAIVHYRLALQHNPRLAEAENNLGRALQLEGKPEEAIEHYRRAIELSPGSAEAHGNLGGVLLVLGRVEQAIVHLRRALALKPDYAKVREKLDRAYSASAAQNDQ